MHSMITPHFAQLTVGKKPESESKSLPKSNWLFLIPRPTTFDNIRKMLTPRLLSKILPQTDRQTEVQM